MLLLVLVLGGLSAPPPSDDTNGATVLAPTTFAMLPNLSTLGVTERKRVFFEYLAPIVRAKNDAVRVQRAQLLRIHRRHQGGDELSPGQYRTVAELARQYRIDSWPDDIAAALDELLLRVDVVPVDLALIQAAKESGWGQSRFALEGNNLFGQWCYTRGCGLVPQMRSGEAQHEVQVFDDVSASVASYIDNLNTGWAYEDLRRIRARLRADGGEITGHRLAPGLVKYSQRRQAYVDEVNSMLRSNQVLVAEVLAEVTGAE